jgi:hypothetical protein
MGTFKTLDAFFKPVPKPGSVANNADAPCPAVPDNNKSVDSVPPAPSQARNSAPPQPTQHVSKPAPESPRSAPRESSSANLLKTEPNAAAALSMPTRKPPPGGGHAIASCKSDLLAEMLHGRKAASLSVPAAAAAAAGELAVSPGAHGQDAPADSRVAPAPAGRSQSAARAPALAAPGPRPSLDGPEPQPPPANAGAVTAARADDPRTGAVVEREREERPLKRPCLPLTPAGGGGGGAAAAAAAAQRGTRAFRGASCHGLAPLERRSSLTFQLQARCQGRLPPHRELWWLSRPGLVQVGWVRVRAGGGTDDGGARR